MTALPISDLKIRKLTIADVHALMAAGTLEEKAPYELIDGVLVEMASDGFPHLSLRSALATALLQSPGLGAYTVLIDAPLILSDISAPEPDIYVYNKGIAYHDLRGPDILLVIEVAESSLERDLRLKAPLYAKHGVREYWVFDLARRLVRIHRAPGDDGYVSVQTLSFDEELACEMIPELRLVTSKLALIR